MDIQEAIKKFEFMRKNDVPLTDISRELGLSMETLRRWEGDRTRSLSQDNDMLTGDVSFSINVDIWRDIGVVLARLSFGVAICALLFKVVGLAKVVAVMLTGGANM